MKRFVVVRAEGYMTSRPASSVFVYTKTILRCKMLVGKSQTLELHPTDAGYAFLQNAFATCNFVHQTCISLPEPLRFAA